MRFTEHELTTALTGTAKQLLAVQRKDVRKGRADIDAVWGEMERYERFKILDALGSQLFPVLVALPDIEVAPVEQCLGEGGGRLRRKAAVTARMAVVRMALQQVPPRSGPDTGVAPDLG